MMITQTTTRESILVRAVKNPEELYRATTLMTATHGRNPSYSCDWLEKNGGMYPHFKREHTRIALCNGELAGALRISTDTLRIGEARLKEGGLSWISIAPRFENRNIRKTLIEDTLEYLKEHRYHLAMMFASSSTYESFGFIGALTDYTVHVDCTKCRPFPRWKRRARRAKPGDIDALQRIQSANSSDISCSILRERGHFANQWEQFKNAWVLANAQGNIEGYLWPRIEVGVLHLDEVEASNDAAYRDMVSIALKRASDRLITRLVFHTSPNHPFMRVLTDTVSSEAIQLNSSSGGMIQIIDIEETLESMIPEWESRINHSLLREMSCEVTLLLNHSPFRIRVHFGAIDISSQMGKNKFSVDHPTFAQLLTGYHNIRDVWPQDRRLITREGRALLETLFPHRNPYMALLDRF